MKVKNFTPYEMELCDKIFVMIDRSGLSNNRDEEFESLIIEVVELFGNKDFIQVLNIKEGEGDQAILDVARSCEISF